MLEKLGSLRDRLKEKENFQVCWFFSLITAFRASYVIFFHFRSDPRLRRVPGQAVLRRCEADRVTGRTDFPNSALSMFIGFL